MALPTFQQTFLPILQLMADGVTRRRPEIIAHIEQLFDLSPQEMSATIESGSRVIGGRVNWGITYLHKADFLEIPSRGNIVITPDGKAVAKDGKELSTPALRELSQKFREWEQYNRDLQRSKRDDLPGETFDDETSSTPEESLSNLLSSLEAALISELQDQVRECSPAFFEQLVVDVLKAMGYGGGFAGDAQVTRYTKDGGIDGIIKQDKFGLETVHVQAKRQQATVGNKDINAFVGAMQRYGVRKGVFVTTSDFSSDAKEYAKEVNGSKVALVNGRELAELMIDNNVGVHTTRTIQLKKIDSDYFDELD